LHSHTRYALVNSTMTFEEAKEYLGEDIQQDGGLSNICNYLDWSPGHEEAVLDGSFTAQELESIAAYMKGFSRLEDRALHPKQVNRE